jgi:hypothetical protein
MEGLARSRSKSPTLSYQNIGTLLSPTAKVVAVRHRTRKNEPRLPSSSTSGYPRAAIPRAKDVRAEEHPGARVVQGRLDGPEFDRASAGQARCALLREGERLSALLLAVLEPLVAFRIAVRRLCVSFACTDAGRLLLEARLHTAIPLDDRRTWGKAPRRQQTGRREHNKDHLSHSDSSFASINQVCRNPRAIATVRE